MTKITFIGAGSTVFARDLLNDIFSFPELTEVTIHLHDIDSERLETSRIVAEHVARKHHAHPTLQSGTDRRAALDGRLAAVRELRGLARVRAPRRGAGRQVRRALHAAEAAT